MAFDLSDLVDPLEVWKAVEGDRSELIALLRSDERLTTRTREALADWLEGTLQPVKLPKGRPRKGSTYLLWEGHDPQTPLGYAGYWFELFRRYIRRKGWHLKKAGRFYWSSEKLTEAIAKRHRIDLEKFTNYMNRAKPKPRPWSFQDYVVRRRRAIALEIHHAKKRGKG
jgi:hypothetical protein